MQGFVPVEKQVADLRTGAVSAVKKVPIHDDAAAHAGAQGHEEHIVAALAAALPVFAQSRHVGIVARLHRETGEPRQILGDVEHAPAQVYAAVHNALAVDCAGHADADAQNVGCGNLMGSQILLDGSGDVRQNLIAAVCGDGGNLPLVEHGAVFVKIGDLDGGAAQINAKAVFHKGRPPNMLDVSIIHIPRKKASP